MSQVREPQQTDKAYEILLHSKVENNMTITVSKTLLVHFV